MWRGGAAIQCRGDRATRAGRVGLPPVLLQVAGTGQDMCAVETLRRVVEISWGPPGVIIAATTQCSSQDRFSIHPTWPRNNYHHHPTNPHVTWVVWYCAHRTAKHVWQPESKYLSYESNKEPSLATENTTKYFCCCATLTDTRNLLLKQTDPDPDIVTANNRYSINIFGHNL